jgi:hypothetical protein
MKAEVFSQTDVTSNAMITEQLIKSIEAMDFSDFEKVWADLRNSLKETDKQNVLTEIIDFHYSDKDLGFYVKVFDKIIDSKVSLDFNVDHWAPTFLSLVVMKSSRQLFDYFLRKGANINFIGDSYAFETEETIKRETEEIGIERYSTCLDFAKLKLADNLTVDYNYSVPDTKGQITPWQDIDHKEEITITKRDYYYLVEQSQYLHNLIHTDRLVDHIKSLGGKTYKQLSEK